MRILIWLLSLLHRLISLFEGQPPPDPPPPEVLYPLSEDWARERDRFRNRHW